MIWEYAGEAISPDLLDDVRSFRDRLPGEGLRAELGALLSPDELTALDERIDDVLRAGVFPEPGPGRPYPWPPV